MSANSSSSSTRSPQPNRARTAQTKVAAQRAAQQRRRRLTVATSSIAVVVALFAALLIAKAAGAGSNSGHAAAGPAPSSNIAAAAVAAATSVPTSALDAVGAGTVGNPPTRIAGTGATALTSDGKPQVVYLGYEWCPFCAAQRWPLIVALSRFGTFSGLGLTESASDDVYPSTNTFTFAHATYTSRYLSFTGVEMQDGNRKPLQTPTAAEQQLLSVYDEPPYVAASAAGGIPFLDLGGKYVISGASYDPQTLAGQDWSKIAASLAQPAGPTAQAIDGSANALTAALCDLTGQQPAAVCSSTGVAKAKGALK